MSSSLACKELQEHKTYFPSEASSQKSPFSMGVFLSLCVNLVSSEFQAVINIFYYIPQSQTEASEETATVQNWWIEPMRNPISSLLRPPALGLLSCSSTSSIASQSLGGSTGLIPAHLSWGWIGHCPPANGSVDDNQVELITLHLAQHKLISL